MLLFVIITLIIRLSVVQESISLFFVNGDDIINKYLWDLDLEDLPFGWDDIYQEALKDYPNGEYIFSACDSESVSSWVNPINCKRMLISRFNSLKSEAKKIFDNKNFDSNNLSKLFSIDVALYYLIFKWCSDENEIFDFNDSKFLDNINNLQSVESYFNEPFEVKGSSYSEIEKKIYPMRFIQLTNISE